MIDEMAPIIPYQGIGGIRLYQSITDMSKVLKETSLIFHQQEVLRFDATDTLAMFFLNGNGKLFKLTALKKYRGKLWGKISTSTMESEILTLESSFFYDDFEEVFVSPKGVFIETDPVSKEVNLITVYVKEMDELDPYNFWRGAW